jgi:hypothetical protein
MNDGSSSPFKGWTQRPPAFLVHVEMPSITTGSGIQVDANHVVTCAHVVCREGPDRYYQYDPGQRPSVVGNVATVHCGGFRAQGSVIAQHAFLDLALLRLSKPRPGVALPPLSRPDHNGEVCIAGLARVGEQCQSSLHHTKIDGRASSQGTTLTQVKHDYGALEGASGGGVFADNDGALLFVGIATLGGELARMGAFTPAETVLRFVEEKLEFTHPRSPATRRETHLLAFGVAPQWEFKTGQLTLPFVAIFDDEGTLSRPSFVSRRALSVADMKLAASDPVTPVHHRLPASADRIEQAEAVIRKLASVVGCRLRLPTRDELYVAWTARTSKRTPQGRPLVLSDFDRNALGVDVPPIGTAEWVRTHDGSVLAVECGNDGQLKASDSRRESSRSHGFRVAFDLEEA